MQGQLAVLAANQAFFGAVAVRDLERMGELWLEGDHSCCIHQAQRPVLGYAAVMESWRNLFRDRRLKKVEYALESVVIRDNVGRVVVTSEKANQVVTNFWERTADGWKLWSHQAGTIKPVPPSTTLGTMALKIPNLCVSAVKAVAKRLTLGRRRSQPPPKQKQLQPELHPVPPR